MSRIILEKYDNGEDKFVVGWDRPCASYFWQHFQKEPEVSEAGEGKWKVTSPALPLGVRTFDTKAEAEEAQWDDWQEMLAFKGYMPSELPNMQTFIDSLPRNIEPLVNESVRALLQEHSIAADPGSIVVDLTTSNVVMASWKVEVQTYGETNWSGNGLRFATEDEAKACAIDLAGRWTMVEKWRTARSFDAVNYKWENGKAVNVSAAG
jgi:hypothetical protein